ncbi:MAG: hypothetical protein U9N42_02715 [Campylobacterota bacterium]|nr:hypothetical protein [Campylobacterota bacterium]
MLKKNSVSINPYNYTYYQSEENSLVGVKEPSFIKDQHVISLINPKNFISSQIQIPKSIDEEDVFDTINLQTTDELSLDTEEIEYIIKYVEVINEESEEEFRTFNVFVVEDAALDEIYLPSVEHAKYIDYIVPTPLLYKTLYKEAIESSAAHIFIYFQDDNSFFTLYNNKEFVYTKSLNLSLDQMHDKYCEIYGEQMPKEDFIKLLLEDGLDEQKENYTYIKELFDDILSHISDIITFVKRAYDLMMIETIYISSSYGNINELDNFTNQTFRTTSTGFNFDYGVTQSQNIDAMHILMHLFREGDYDCNFTKYFRPPGFSKRDSGKLILLTAGSIILSMLYPVVYWSMTAVQDIEILDLKSRYSEIHNKKTSIEKQIKLKKDEQKIVKDKLKVVVDEFTNRKNTLTKIRSIKVDYPMKAKLIALFTKDFNRFKVNLLDVSYGENGDLKRFYFDLIAKNDKDITKLVKYLTDKKLKKFQFLLNKIAYDSELKVYKCALEVRIR